MTRYRARLTFSPPVPQSKGEWLTPTVRDGRYAIYCGDHLVIRDRTFSRDAADDICAALEEARMAGAEEGVEA